MAAGVQDIEAGDRSIEIVGIRRGMVCGVVGLEDWDVSRMREAREMVIYDFGGRQAAYDACNDLSRTQDMRLRELDDHFFPGATVVLGAGVAPPGSARLPVKYRVLAENGFSLDPLLTFDRCAEILRDGAWGEMPPVRAAGDGREGVGEDEADEGDGVDGEGGLPPRQGARRLGAAPRLHPGTRHARREPLFKVPVRGFLRRIKATSWGIDEFGDPILGSTWVSGFDRYADKGDAPEGRQPRRPRAARPGG